MKGKAANVKREYKFSIFVHSLANKTNMVAKNVSHRVIG